MTVSITRNTTKKKASKLIRIEIISMTIIKITKKGNRKINAAHPNPIKMEIDLLPKGRKKLHQEKSA